MRVPRLYIDAALAVGERIALPEPLAHKLGRVLRLSTGSPIVLFNGDGRDHHARLEWSSSGCALARLEGSQEVRFRESPLALTLIQGLARGEKMDWIVQKATELGVRAILPLASERSELRLDGKRLARRLEHWRAVAIAACEQCGRAILPEILAPATPAELERLPLPEARLLLAPDGEDHPLTAPAADGRLALAIGPEGGFSPAEKQRMVQIGFAPWRLGPRILRTETAAIAATAALLAWHGDFGRAAR